MSARPFWMVTACASLACSGAGGDDFFKSEGPDATTASTTTTGGLVDTASSSTTTSTSGAVDGGNGGTSSSSTTSSEGGDATSSGGAGDETTTTTTTSSAAGGNGGTSGAGGATQSTGGAESGGAGGGDASGGSGTTTGSGTGGNGGSGNSTATGGNGGSGGDACVPSDEICDGHDNDCDEEADEGDACPDACSGATFESHVYLFCVEPGSNFASRDWEWAMDFCLERGQTLVRIETSEENAFLYEQLDEMDGSGDAWIAATDQENEDEWVWANGDDPDTWTPFYDGGELTPIDDAFSDWSQGEPDNTPGGTFGGADCAALESLGGGDWGWADRPCSAEYDRVVCETQD